MMVWQQTNAAGCAERASSQEPTDAPAIEAVTTQTPHVPQALAALTCYTLDIATQVLDHDCHKYNMTVVAHVWPC